MWEVMTECDKCHPGVTPRDTVMMSHSPAPAPTGWPGCLVLKQGAVNQLFLEVFLMFLACLDHKWWAEFHLGILGPQE